MTVGIVLVRDLEPILVVVGEFLRTERRGEAVVTVVGSEYGMVVMVKRRLWMCWPESNWCGGVKGLYSLVIRTVESGAVSSE
jgi:hypothetical protein